MSILYVEDDTLTRQTIARRLRRRGYTVVEAQSGEEALSCATGHSFFSVVLLDVDLPGINGLETYRSLREIQPGLPAVVCSGCLSVVIHQGFSELGVPGQFLLVKPCLFSELLSALRAARGETDGATLS
jgi:CheY-like chemotaxis protein